MRKILRFIPIQLTFFLVLGILFGFYFDVEINYLVVVLVVLLFISGISYWQSNKSFSPNLSFNILTYILSFSLGIAAVTIQDNLNDQHHYSHFIADGNSAILVIDKVLKSSNYHDKYEVSVLKVNEISTSGKVLLNIQKDSLSRLKVDDKLYLKSDFKEVNSPKNPYYFDYKKYLEKQQIHHQLFTSNTEFLSLPKRVFSFKGLAAKFRVKINKALIKNGFKNDELGVINALLLGQRQDISPDLIQSYTGAGAIHILAVSGLHVGIILLLLNFVFKPIESIKHGKVYKTIILVLILWSFAIIAGLSASVVRAVSMFTIIAIAMNLNRPTNVFNTLAISMFFLLLFKPTFIFDVGFQLSYLAVFAIVIIQPMLYSLWHPKTKFFKFLWGIFTVTLAAQFGIIPISLFYFHQFPGLFFVSNLVIIPFLGTILGFGIIVIGLALLNVLPEFLASTYGSIIGLMNTFVGWISDQESFLFKDISFNIEHVLISYLLLILIINFIKQKTYRSVIYLLIAILFSQGYFIYDSYKSNSKVFVIFHKSRYSIIGFKNKNQLNLYHNLNDSVLKYDKVITNYKVGEHITKIKQDSIQSVYLLKANKILVIDSIGIYNVKTFTPDIILLRNSPKINLKRLIDSLHPKLIISDGSNYKSYQERWSKTCDVQKIPFHQTSKKGAYIYKF